MNKLLLAIAFVGLCACGSTSTAAGPSPSPSPVPTACTDNGAASTNWPNPSTAPRSPGIVSASATGNVLTLTFQTGTPAFDVKQQSSAHFTSDPGGLPLNLAGNAGVLIKLHGFRGDVNNYDGGVPATALGPLLVEMKKTGDFEGVISFGVGLDSAGCANVASSGNTLTFTFITPPA